MQDAETVASNWLKEMQKGYIRIATLILLSKKPYHGYEIMKEIKRRTRGFWQPTAGGMYPILQDLEKSGYVRGNWDTTTKRRRKIYELTKVGNTVLRRAVTKEKQLATTMRNLLEEYMKDVLEVDTRPHLPLNIPLPISELLIEVDETQEDTIKRLENQRRQIQNIIKQLQKKLGTINQSIKDSVR